jgi:aspartate aminotransferase
MNLSEKVLSIEPSQTLVFNNKALEMIKKNYNVIKMTAGEPDFKTPEPIIEAAYEAMKAGKTKYTKSTGIDELREKISEKLHVDNNLNYSASEIIVTNGGKQAIFNTLMAITNQGDEIIIISPAWVSYEAQILLCGGKVKIVNSKIENDFIPDIKDIENAINEKTKAIIINSPNNPTGAIYPAAFLEELSKVIKKHEIFVISDEVYEKLSFDAEHISIASFEGMKPYSIVINAFSKSHSMTGWRIGYLAGPAEMVKQAQKIQSHLCSNVNTPTQYAALKALDINPVYMIDAFKERRKFVSEKLDEANIDYFYPKGAFYFFINVSKYFNSDLKNSYDFAIALLEKGKVGLTPGSAFFAEGYLRLSYACSMEDLKEGLNRIINFINNL